MTFLKNILLLEIVRNMNIGNILSLPIVPSSTSHKTAKQGDQLWLQCHVPDRSSHCQWTKDGFGLGLEHNLTGFPRYSMDNCDLIIDPVKLEDEDRFQCQVSPSSNAGSEAAVLQVQVVVHEQPGPPHILQAKHHDVVEVSMGERVTLECQSQGAKPPAEIVWRYGDRSLVEAEVFNNVTSMGDGKGFRTRSFLTLLSREGEISVQCEALNPAIDIPRRSPQIKVRVQDQISTNLKR